MAIEAPSTNDTAGQAFERDKSNTAEVLETARDKERDVLGAVKDAQKATVGQATPVPTDFDAVSSPSDLKARLDWGEPALSILDVRDRTAYNHERITGAMPMPMENLASSAKSAFEPSRDIFVYGGSDGESTKAADQLRSAGMQRVTTIKGGMAAWKAVGGATEGQIYMESPVPGLK